MLRVRAPWLRLPCSSTAGTPEALSCLASFLARCLVRVKTTVRPGAAVRSSSTGRCASAPTWSTWWLIVDTGDWAESSLVRHGIGEEALDEDVDRTVERRREEQALALRRRLLHDPANAGQEAEVGHVVGLVEDRDLDAVEEDVALLHEVLEAAGAGDDDVDAVPEPLDLRVLADAAEDRLRGEAERLGEGRHGRVDLGDELAGRREDQGAGPAGLTALAGLGQARQQRQQERVASCRSRCGRGRARRGRRASRAASLPGSGSGR